MALATAEAIRDRLYILIESLTPTSLADVKFRRHRNELGADFDAWAEKNTAGSLRRFQIRESGDDVPPLVSDTLTELVRVRFDIRVAYPQTHRYGAANAMDRDAVMNQDWKKINAAVGLYGGANFSSTYDCTPLGCTKSRESGGGIDYLVIAAEYEYQREVAPSSATAVSSDVVMWGDSLTLGYGWGATTTYQTIASRLAAKSPARTVYNEGVAGETSTQIKARLLADTTGLSAKPTIIWAGHNNVDSTATVLSDIAAMVAALGHTNYLVVSLINGTTDSGWWSGGSHYNNMITINTALASTYGSHYVDVRSMLVAAYNPNYAQDVIDHGHDIVPASLRSDYIHLTDKGYQFVASKIWENASTLLGSAPTGGVVGVTIDATSSKYAPSDASEWSLALASAGITSGNPDSAWLCEELSSNPLVDFVGFTSLNAGSTPTGNNSVTGWTRKSVNTVEGSSMMGFSSSATVNLATTSALLLAYVQPTGSAASDREVMGLGSGYDHRYVVLTSGGKFKATGLAGASATGTATPGTTVHPVVLKVDRARSTYTVYTDQEKLTPAWTAPSGGGSLIGLGDQITAGAPPAGFLYVALFTGTSAEMSDAQVRTLLTTLGWTVAW